jgi:hypothetical protein
MSSTRKPPAKGAAGPAPERKAASGPVLTPGVLTVIYVIIAAIGAGVYFSQVVKTHTEKMAALNSRITTAQTAKATYQKKREKLEVARKLNVSVRDKLQEVSYRFLTDQSSVIPFWEQTFFPVLNNGSLQFGEDTKIKVDVYEFQINMAMSPFNTLPPSSFFEDADNLFPINYIGEKGGQPEDTPVNTQPADFLTPYTFEMIKFIGTYDQVKRFIRDLQVKQDKTLFTVHCVRNDKEGNSGFYRTASEWNLQITVYFINPEAPASGDSPPALPGSESC